MNDIDPEYYLNEIDIEKFQKIYADLFVIYLCWLIIT